MVVIIIGDTGCATLSEIVIVGIARATAVAVVVIIIISVADGGVHTGLSDVVVVVVVAAAAAEGLKFIWKCESVGVCGHTLIDVFVD